MRAHDFLPRHLHKLVTYLDEHGPTAAKPLRRHACEDKGKAFRIAREKAKRLGLITFLPNKPRDFAGINLHEITEKGREWLQQPGNRWPEKKAQTP